MTSGRTRWGYLLTSFVMNIMLGSAYSWSVFSKPLIDGYGATTFTAMLPFAVALGTFSLGMVFAGKFVDRHGPRKIAMLGGLLVSVGYMLSYLMDRTGWPVGTLILTYGVVMGLGIGFSYNPPIPTASRWFPDRKGLATGFVVMGYGLSPLFTAPLADYLIKAYGVPSTFLFMGVLFLVVLVPLGSLLRFPPADWKAPEPKGASRRTWTPLSEVGTKAMLRSPAFWSAWLMYVVGTAGGFMVIGNAKAIAMTMPGVVAMAGLAVAAVQVMAVFNSIGRPIFGRSADAYGPRRSLMVMYLVMLVAMAVLALSTAWEQLYVGIAITGIVFGGFLAVMPAFSAHFFGLKNQGQNYGVLFTGYGLGAVVATFAIGPIKDSFGSYVPAFYVGMILSLVGLAISFLARPPRPVAARVEPEKVPLHA
ncbi:MAG TPA: OFA family MFS transporter [Thermoplasmata archaeon]|nr:OFA family MFS transporter [Thermoplasmata archaeon]